MQTSLMGETEIGPEMDDQNNEANGQDVMEVD
jgi:hypothetical protein